MAENDQARTFGTIELKPEATNGLPFPEFVTELLKKLEALKQTHFQYYENLRRKNALWANEARRLLAWFGAVAFLLTGIATGLRFADPDLARPFGSDKTLLLIVLAIYAVMGTISFYEKSTDRASSYFRHLAAIFGIRDLWTKLQFEFLKELTALKTATDHAAVEDATRARLCVLAECFCSDLNRLSVGELAEWKTEFLTSLSDLAEASRRRGDDVTMQVQDSVRAANDAKTAAEKAAADAKDTAKAVEDATRPALITVKLIGDSEDDIVILIDGVEAGRSRGKSVALNRVSPGLKTLSARFTKGGKPLEVSQNIDAKPGLQDVAVELS